MNPHTPPLPDEADKDWTYVERVRRDVTRDVHVRFRVSNAEEIADTAISHVLIQAQRPGAVRDFRRVVFTHAARMGRAEEKRQARLVGGDEAVALAASTQAASERDGPLAALLNREKIEILQSVLRELTPAHRRTLLFWLADKPLTEIAKEEGIHISTAAQRKRAALKSLQYKLASYFEEPLPGDMQPDA